MAQDDEPGQEFYEAIATEGQQSKASGGQSNSNRAYNLKNHPRRAEILDSNPRPDLHLSPGLVSTAAAARDATGTIHWGPAGGTRCFRTAACLALQWGAKSYHRIRVSDNVSGCRF